MTRIFGIILALLLTAILIYLSRFWIWQAPWSNEGLFAIKTLSPRGDVIRQLVRGTPLNVFDVLVWFSVAILSLSCLQWLHDRIASLMTNINK